MDDKLKDAFMEYMDCPCRFFAPMKDDDPLMEAFAEAKKRGNREGFTPVIVTVDETLWECLIINSDEENDGADEYGFDIETVRDYRKRILAEPLLSGETAVREFLSDRQGNEGEGLDEGSIGHVTGGEEVDYFVGYWDYETEKTYPLILAEIPVKNPWEIFAWLPFGGWNECPNTLDLMSVAKYWFGKYRAVPAVVTHDVLEFDLPAPIILENSAKELALEHYALCPDMLDQGDEDGNLGKLADSLRKSTKWYFWWD